MSSFSVNLPFLRRRNIVWGLCGYWGSFIGTILEPFILCNIEGCWQDDPTCICPFRFDACTPDAALSLTDVSLCYQFISTSHTWCLISRTDIHVSSKRLHHQSPSESPTTAKPTNVPTKVSKKTCGHVVEHPNALTIFSLYYPSYPLPVQLVVMLAVTAQ